MDIYVRAYDNATSTWGPLTLAKTWTHYAGGVQWSYHDYSTMVLGPDGKLHVFQADHCRAMYEIVAPAAHSISGSWKEELISSDRNAYPSVNVVGNSIYLVYVRDYSGSPDTYRTLRFIKKDWNGSAWSAWSAPRTIIDTRRMMGTTSGVGDRYDEVYQQSLSHPVSFSMAGWNSGTRTYLVAYNLGGAGDDNSVKLARFSGGSWNHMTVDRGMGFGLRDISVIQENAIELAYVTGAPVRVKLRKVTYTGAWPATVSALYPDLAIPMIGIPTPDKVSFLQIVATQASSGRAFKMFGTTFNNASRQTDYTGDWNGFGVYYR
jgi:hypothetical protein